jgi:hypothetical protein
VERGGPLPNRLNRPDTARSPGESEEAELGGAREADTGREEDRKDEIIEKPP